jgi:hypothetical protein
LTLPKILRISSVVLWLSSLCVPAAHSGTTETVLGIELLATGTVFAPMIAIEAFSRASSGLMLIAYSGNILIIADALRQSLLFRRPSSAPHPGWTATALCVSAYVGLVTVRRPSNPYLIRDVAELPGFWIWLLAVLFLTAAGVIERREFHDAERPAQRITWGFSAAVFAVIVIATAIGITIARSR